MKLISVECALHDNPCLSHQLTRTLQLVLPHPMSLALADILYISLHSNLLQQVKHTAWNEPQ